MKRINLLKRVREGNLAPEDAYKKLVGGQRMRLTRSCRKNTEMVSSVMELFDVDHHENYYNGGFRGYCVTAILIALGIPIGEIEETWRESENGYDYKSYNHYLKYLEDFGYEWNQVSEEYGISCCYESDTRVWKYQTEIRRLIRERNNSSEDKYILIGLSPTDGGAHAILVDYNGVKLIDTSMNSRWQIHDIIEVRKMEDLCP